MPERGASSSQTYAERKKGGLIHKLRCAEIESPQVAWSRACFESYWGRDEDLAQEPVLERIAIRVGLDPTWLLERIGKPELKDRLRANTEELVARGGFGSPTMFVNGEDMYFGNDRLPLLEAALARV